MSDLKLVIMLVSVFILAIFAASAGKWELVGTVVTGYFALMNLSKGENNGKTDTVPVSGNTP